MAKIALAYGSEAWARILQASDRVVGGGVAGTDAVVLPRVGDFRCDPEIILGTLS